MPKLEKQLAIIIRKRMFKQQVYILSIGNMNPFHAIGLFLYTLKTSQNQKFINVLWGYKRDQWRGMG